jgi:hypothetical protein
MTYSGIKSSELTEERSQKSALPRIAETDDSFSYPLIASIYAVHK